MTTRLRKREGRDPVQEPVRPPMAPPDMDVVALFMKRSLPDAADLVIDTVGGRAKSRLGCVDLVDPPVGTPILSFSRGLSDLFLAKTAEWRRSLAGDAIRFRKPILCGDSPRSRRPLNSQATIEGIREIVCLPLLTAKNIVGSLTVFRTTDDPFAPDELQALFKFCVPAAIALDNALAYELQQRRVRQLSILNGIVSGFSSDKNVESLIRHLAQSARQLLDAEYCFVGLTNGDVDTIGTIINAEGGLPLPATDGDGRRILEKILRERRVLKGIVPETGVAERSTSENGAFIRNWLGISLIGQGGPLGAFAVVNRRGATPTAEDDGFLTTFALHAATAIERLRLFEETERLAIADGLTGLYNHREFQKQLQAEIDRSKRYNREFSLLLLDIDHFKKLNDTFGHLTGDAVLKDIAAILREQVRSVDLPARYVGEEFAIILPETSGEGAFLVAERIRNRIYEHIFKTRDGNRAMISATIGVATFPHDADTRDEIIDAADQAMYFAKGSGRNAVCRYAETLSSKIGKEEGTIERILFDPKLSSLKDLAAAVEARSRFFRGDSEAIGKYAELLGAALGLPGREREHLRIAGILHDIGTIGIPPQILNKPGPLSPEERQMIERHPVHAQTLLDKIEHLQAIMPAIVFHHERYDGKGYPRGLKGDEIPLLARILAVAEAYHAMISLRPYRPGMSREEAVRELRAHAGTQFDPQMVDTFVLAVS